MKCRLLLLLAPWVHVAPGHRHIEGTDISRSYTADDSEGAPLRCGSPSSPKDYQGGSAWSRLWVNPCTSFKPKLPSSRFSPQKIALFLHETAEDFLVPGFEDDGIDSKIDFAREVMQRAGNDLASEYPEFAFSTHLVHKTSDPQLAADIVSFISEHYIGDETVWEVKATSEEYAKFAGFSSVVVQLATVTKGRNLLVNWQLPEGEAFGASLAASKTLDAVSSLYRAVCKLRCILSRFYASRGLLHLPQVGISPNAHNMMNPGSKQAEVMMEHWNVVKSELEKLQEGQQFLADDYKEGMTELASGDEYAAVTCECESPLTFAVSSRTM
eukprot:TRINITY_DN71311_c0_g1_i1.p1 TRINITY_DN71311_c0_g1~~TRINITY_DN71311_c0_g1_i1.p1  ORF type:complete len:327 (+),score=61.63 TRINITY_DN71311_c0_g1_i1:144-1124(+)